MPQRSVIAVYAKDDMMRESILNALPSYYDRLVVPANTPVGDLDSIAHATEGIVCCADNFAQQVKQCPFRELRVRFPLYYLVDVTDEPRESSGVLLGSITPASVTTFLPSAVVRARIGKRLYQLMIASGSAAHLSKIVRFTLVKAINPVGVVTSVEKLAALVGWNRRTLWHHWEDMAKERNAVRLLWLLNSILLFKAVGLKTPERSWATVARMLNVHEHRLIRHSERWLGVKLRRLPEPPEEFVWGYLKPMISDIIGYRNFDED